MKKRRKKVVDARDIARMRLVLNFLKREYRDRLIAAASTGSLQSVGNRFPWHAKIATEELLNAAKGGVDVSVVSGGPGELYDGEVLKKLQQRINEGSKVRILVWSNKPSAITDEIDKLRQHNATRNGAGSLRVKLAGLDPSDHQMIHFCLIDNRHYRREKLHPDFSSIEFNDFAPEIPATVAFNDVVGGQELKELFTELWGLLVSGDE